MLLGKQTLEKAIVAPKHFGFPKQINSGQLNVSKSLLSKLFDNREVHMSKLKLRWVGMGMILFLNIFSRSNARAFN